MSIKQEVIEHVPAYVWKRADELDVGVDVYRHAPGVVDVAEKAAALGWPRERMVKTLYMKNPEKSGYVGVTLPWIRDKMPLKDILGKVLKISGKEAKRYVFDGLPPGMINGTSTPFVEQDVFDTHVYIAIVYTPDGMDGRIVTDVGCGGTEPEAKRLSLHLPYWSVHEILDREFGSSRVHALREHEM